jgi:transposase
MGRRNKKISICWIIAQKLSLARVKISKLVKILIILIDNQVRLQYKGVAISGNTVNWQF